MGTGMQAEEAHSLHAACIGLRLCAHQRHPSLPATALPQAPRPTSQSLALTLSCGDQQAGHEWVLKPSSLSSAPRASPRCWAAPCAVAALAGLPLWIAFPLPTFGEVGADWLHSEGRGAVHARKACTCQV